LVAQFIERKATELLKQAGQDAPPIDPMKVAEHLGLRVAYTSLSKGLSGRLFPDRLLIEVNEAEHRHRQRFTIGHEIGHFVLGHSQVFCRFDDRSSDDPTRPNERQANWFSTCVLMPEALVRQSWARHGDAKKVAAEFEVSELTMWRRLDSELNLLGLQPTSRAHREGWR
jgi:Zn-dependent peptidase ImmA (M78 family)